MVYSNIELDVDTIRCFYNIKQLNMVVSKNKILSVQKRSVPIFRSAERSVISKKYTFTFFFTTYCSTLVSDTAVIEPQIHFRHPSTSIYTPTATIILLYVRV